MSEPLGQPHVPYPRPNSSPGTPEQLESLAIGYFGLVWISFVNLSLATFGLMLAFDAFWDRKTDHSSFFFFCGATGLLFGIVMAVVSINSLNRIAFGSGQHYSRAIGNGIVIALCGFISVVPMLAIITLGFYRLRRFGVRTNLVGHFTMKNVREAMVKLSARTEGMGDLRGE